MYAFIKEQNESKTHNVEILLIIINLDKAIFLNNSEKTIVKLNTTDKTNDEKPINELIYNFFSIDCFFLAHFLLMPAYNFHHA